LRATCGRPTPRRALSNIPGAKYVELPGENHIPVCFERDMLDQIVNETEEFLTGYRADFDLDRVLATVMFTDTVARVLARRRDQRAVSDGLAGTRLAICRCSRRPKGRCLSPSDPKSGEGRLPRLRTRPVPNIRGGSHAVSSVSFAKSRGCEVL